MNEGVHCIKCQESDAPEKRKVKLGRRAHTSGYKIVSLSQSVSD